MSTHADGQGGEPVLNYDGLWNTQARWYHVGDLSLGRRGVPQIAVAYALAGVALVLGVRACPVAGPLLTGVLPWTVWGLGPLVLCTLLAFVRVAGQPMHVFLPCLAEHLCGPRHLLGWQPVRDPLEVWAPVDLVVAGDGGPRFPFVTFTGPGEIVRTRRAVHSRFRRTVVDRVRRRPACEVLREKPGGPLDEPRVLAVAVGVRVRVVAAGDPA